MKLHLRNGLRTRQRMHIIACSACAGIAAFMLFVVFGTAESEESMAESDNALMAMENESPVTVRELSFISTTRNFYNDDISIEFHSQAARPVELKLVSIAGKDIARKKLFAREGINALTWHCNDDQKGIFYLYICTDEKTSEVIKVVRN